MTHSPDPRLVDLYDGDNPDGPDHDFFRALSQRPEVRSVLDLGCGTGILTVTLGDREAEVVGVDPSMTMLEFARRRPGAERVTWLLGDSGSLPGGPFDLVVMSGNVAQHISDSAWTQTLSDVRRVVRDGAVLSFESRNPTVRAWESWHQPEATVRDTVHGQLEEWSEVSESEGVVTLTAHNRFRASGDLVTETQELWFRSRDMLTDELVDAGFVVVAVWGDWHGTPFEGSQPIMVFEAVALGRVRSSRQS